MKKEDILNIETGDYIWVNENIYANNSRLRTHDGKWQVIFKPNKFYKVLYVRYSYNIDDVSKYYEWLRKTMSPKDIMPAPNRIIYETMTRSEIKELDEKGLKVNESYIEVEIENKDLGYRRIKLIRNGKIEHYTKLLQTIKKETKIELEDVNYFNI